MSRATLAAVVGLVQQTAPATPSDDTAQTIALVIAGLLGLAVVLAVLTFWYWRRTDPRRAAGRAGARPDTSPPARSGTADVGGSSPPSSRTAPEHTRPAEGGISAEEWLRLTGGGNAPSRGEP